MTTAPKPQWTAEAVRSAADALYQALLPELATPGEHLIAKDLAATQAMLLQFSEALEVQHKLLTESAQLAQDVAAAHRLQVRALSKRLEALEQR